MVCIKGLTEAATLTWFEDRYARFAFDKNGLLGFLEYLEAATIHTLEKTPNCLQPLLEWGLDLDAARAITSLGEDLHKGPGPAIFGYLREINGVPPNWPQTSEGWPAEYPLNTVFHSSVQSLRALAAGTNIPSDSSSLRPTVFLSESSRIKGFLPLIDENRFLVFHATSWESGVSIELGINLYLNSQNNLDLGAGFYVTESLECAMWWALHEPTRRLAVRQPLIMIYSLPWEYILNCQAKELAGEEWVNTVGFYRNGIPLGFNPNSFDILCGPVCQSAHQVTLGEREPVPHQEFTQICFKTQAALRNLRYEGAIFFRDRTYD